MQILRQPMFGQKKIGTISRPHFFTLRRNAYFESDTKVASEAFG